MAKILKIDGEKIYVGTDDGNLLELNRKELPFEPHVGDQITIFSNGTERIISRDGAGGSTATIATVASEMVSPKSRVVAAVLALFFGLFSVHNFYVGKIFRGVAFLITSVACWIITVCSLGFGSFVLAIPGAWLLIEFLLILVGRYEDGDGLPITEW